MASSNYERQTCLYMKFSKKWETDKNLTEYVKSKLWGGMGLKGGGL